jgi:hypothetical protein
MQEMIAPVPTYSVVQSVGRAQVNITDLMNSALPLTIINGDRCTYQDVMQSR